MNGMGVLWGSIDLLLLLGVTLRLTRLIVLDDLGEWWVKEPLTRRVAQSSQRTQDRWGKYLDGLDCPWCVGFWLGVVAALSLLVAGGPGPGTSEVWRWIALVFTLNYIAAHVGPRLGDTE